MFGYLLSVLFGIGIGYFVYGLLFGKMSVLGRIPGGTQNVALTGNNTVNPYYLTGLRARFTSLGLTLVISLFGILAVGSTSFENFHLSEITNIVANNPIKSLTLLIVTVLSACLGLYIKSRTITGDKATADSLQYMQGSNQSGGTTRIL